MSAAPRPWTTPSSTRPGMLSCAGTVSRCPASSTSGRSPRSVTPASTQVSPASRTRHPGVAQDREDVRGERRLAAGLRRDVDQLERPGGEARGEVGGHGGRIGTAAARPACRGPYHGGDVQDLSRHGRTTQTPRPGAERPGRAKQRAFCIAALRRATTSPSCASCCAPPASRSSARSSSTASSRTRTPTSAPASSRRSRRAAKAADANVVACDDELTPAPGAQPREGARHAGHRPHER